MSNLTVDFAKSRRLRILVAYLMNRKVFLSDKGHNTYPLLDMVTKKVELVSKQDINYLCSQDLLDMHFSKAFFQITPKGFGMALDRLKKSGGKITTDPSLSQKSLTWEEINAIYKK